MSASDTGVVTPVFLALSCVGFIASAPATAQSAPEGDQPTQLEGVAVTDTAIEDQGYRIRESNSRGFTAPLIDTPRSVAIVPPQVIRDTGSATLMEALRTVPGITMGAGEGGNPVGDRPFIRGIDSQASTFLDGVRDVGAQSREIFNLEQIEVVRGSNSSFGGRGGGGGTLNLVSKIPLAEDFIAGSVSYGSDDYKRAAVDLNGRLGDAVGLRMNAMWHDQNVAGRDEIYQKRWGAAPSITIGIDKPARLTLSYYHLETDELPDSGMPFKYTISNVPIGVTRTSPAEELNGRKVDRDNFYGLVTRDFRKTNVDQATARVEADIGSNLMVRNILRYGHSTNDYIFTNPDDSAGNVAGTATQPPGRVARSPKNRWSNTRLAINQTEIRGQATSAGIEHSFSAGLEWSWEKAKRGNYAIVSTPRCPTIAGANGAPPGIAPYNCTDLFSPAPNDPWAGSVSRNGLGTATIADADTISVYTFDTLSFSDSLLLNLGIRYDDYSTEVRGPIVAGVRSRLIQDDKLVSYQAGLTFKPVPNGSIYASYSTANTPPGSFLGEGQEGNALISTQDLEPEKTESFEIGTKWDVFNEDLSLTLALFRTDTSNARAPVDAGGAVAFIGDRRIDGVEFGFNGNITPDWNIFGGYTYMDSEIRNAGLTFTDGIGAPSVNMGKRFPNTPAHSFTAFTTYRITPAFSLGGGAIYNSKVFGGYSDQRIVNEGQVVVTRELARYVPGYWRFDANALFRLNEQLDLRFNIQNLTDKRYYDRAYSTHYASIAPGRSAFVTLNFRY